LLPPSYCDSSLPTFVNHSAPLLMACVFSHRIFEKLPFPSTGSCLCCHQTHSPRFLRAPISSFPYVTTLNPHPLMSSGSFKRAQTFRGAVRVQDPRVPRNPKRHCGPYWFYRLPHHSFFREPTNDPTGRAATVLSPRWLSTLLCSSPLKPVRPKHFFFSRPVVPPPLLRESLRL